MTIYTFGDATIESEGTAFNRNYNDQLIKLMADNGLSCKTVSKLSGYSLHTIRAYRYPLTSKARRNLLRVPYEHIATKIEAYLRVKEKDA